MLVTHPRVVVGPMRYLLMFVRLLGHRIRPPRPQAVLMGLDLGIRWVLMPIRGEHATCQAQPSAFVAALRRLKPRARKTAQRSRPHRQGPAPPSNPTFCSETNTGTRTWSKTLSRRNLLSHSMLGRSLTRSAGASVRAGASRGMIWFLSRACADPHALLCPPRRLPSSPGPLQCSRVAGLSGAPAR